MKNVKMEIQGKGKNKKLVITIDLKKDYGETKSGKNISVASTLGNKRVPEADGFFIGINCYKKIEE